MKILSILGTFWESQKLVPAKHKKYVFLLQVLDKNENIVNPGYFLRIAKISSRKTQKIVNPQKFRATR